MKTKPSYKKKNFPVDKIRRFLEPTPVVLLSSKWQETTNIMTMAWYTVMEFNPSLIGCMISQANYSFELIKKSKQCVINLPTRELEKTVVKIGNCCGSEVDKFTEFKLTPIPSKKVDVPLINECYANFECRLYDGKLINKYNFFIFEVVNAIVATTPKYPKTIHYRGDSVFMTSGGNIKIPSKV